VFEWPNSKTWYDGEFHKDKFHGQGKFKWEDNRVYDGEWKNGLLNGYGVLTWADERVSVIIIIG
jgi:hypothetical protein